MKARESLNKLLVSHYQTNLLKTKMDTHSVSNANPNPNPNVNSANGSGVNRHVLRDPCLNKGYSRSPAQKR